MICKMALMSSLVVVPPNWEWTEVNSNNVLKCPIIWDSLLCQDNQWVLESDIPSLKQKNETTLSNLKNLTSDKLSPVTGWNLDQSLQKFVTDSTHLNLEGAFTDHHFRQLTSLNLNLKTLSIKFQGQTFQIPTLAKFISIQSETLTKLHISGASLPGLIIDLLSVEIPGLKTLEFSCKGANLLVGNATSQIIKRLSVVSSKMTCTNGFVCFGNQFLNPISTYLLDSNVTIPLGNLRKLEINARVENLFGILDGLKKLKELTLLVTGLKTVDGVLMGLGEKKCRGLRKIWKVDENAAANKYWRWFGSEPYSALKRLRVLSLKSNGSRGALRPKMTDLVCDLVVVKMKELQVLEFCGSNPVNLQVSEWVHQEMKEKFLILRNYQQE